MILTKLISIDTSIFSSLAKDYRCDDKQRKGQATKFIEYLNSNGFIPFFSFHHIQEMLQHESDDEIYFRWSLIKRFPMVAWFCSHNDRAALGSIVDIHATEVKYLAKTKNLDTKSLLSKVKKDLLRYSSGDDFVSAFENVSLELRYLGLIDAQQKEAKAIESLSHTRNPEIDKIKLSVLNSSKLKSPAEALRSFNELERSIKNTLIERGDQKLTDQGMIARQFINDVKSQGAVLYNNDGVSLLEKFINIYGVKLHQITSKTTVGDLGYIAIYNAKSKQIAEILNLSAHEIESLPQENIPSWIIWREIDKMMKNEPRAHGSNVIDKHVSILALYVDIFITDKRVSNYFRQLKQQKPILSGYFNKIIKLSHYCEFQRADC
jgi:hypothetical protein